jgi:RNA polymerase sigma-70 factor (ECF subfamily)
LRRLDATDAECRAGSLGWSANLLRSNRIVADNSVQSVRLRSASLRWSALRSTKLTGPTDDAAEHLSAARGGSREAVGQALQACRKYLLLVARQEFDEDLRAKGGASDLVQETFLKAHHHFDRFHGETEGELLAWLRQLLLNNLASFRRLFVAGKRRVGREVRLDGGDSSSPVRELSADAPSPSEQVLGQERDEALHGALGRLPEDYRHVLILRHVEGWSFEEIGQATGRSANAARKLWARAVERLQHDLDVSL